MRPRSELVVANDEDIAVPITLVLLLVVFGSVVSAVLPLAVGAFAVFGAFFSTWIIAQLNDVSIFSINLITALGLGLAIDYSLPIVSRRQPAARACSRGWQWPARCALCSCSPRRSCAPSASAAWPSSWWR